MFISFITDSIRFTVLILFLNGLLGPFDIKLSNNSLSQITRFIIFSIENSFRKNPSNRIKGLIFS